MITPTRHREMWNSLCYEPVDEHYKLTKEELKIIHQEMEEVSKRVKQIRDGWSPTEAASRLVGTGGCTPWTVPEYRVQYVAAEPGSPPYRKEKRTKIYRQLP